MTITFTAPLLDAEQERDLAKRIEAGLAAQAVLDGLMDAPDASDRELRILVDEGERAFQRFVESNLRLVARTVNPVAARSSLDADDLFQEGVLGLIEGVRRFDYRRGVRFATCALPWIRMRVNEAALTRAGQMNVPAHRARLWFRVRAAQESLAAMRLPADAASVAQIVDITPRLAAELMAYEPPHMAADGTVFDLVSSDADEDEDGDLVSLRLHALVHILPLAERQVIELLYGTSGRPAVDYHVAALTLGVSTSTVRRREHAALDHLRVRAHEDAMAA